MKKFKKALITIGATLMVGITSAAIASCKSGDTVKYVFETNGGEKVASVTVKVGKEYTLPIPQKDGYEFEGWYTNAKFTGDPVTSVIAEEGVTYYAKWAQLCAINLQLEGGKLSQTTVYLKEGANVYDFMQNYVPTKEGLVFGAWFNNGAELPKNVRMPVGGLTLTAKYKVAYKVEIWKQEIGSTEYVKDETDTEGYAYVGENFRSEQKLVGFKEVVKTGENGTFVEKVLSETASENVFRHYFDRESFTVNFKVAYPDGSAETSEGFTVTYGEAVTVPSDYICEGYCLLGWSTSANGEVEYESNFLYNALYNKDEEMEEVKAATFLPERNTTLYAVWNRGYADMFGSNDYIYVIDKASENIYLSRGDVFFQGKMLNDTDFLFINSGNALLRGKLLVDGRFAYYKTDRRKSSTLFVTGKGLVETDKIFFDEYNGITYSVEDEDGNTTQSVGEYIKDESGYYVATFTEGDGEYVGKTLTLFVGTYKDSSAFQVRNEEEYGMGQLVCGTVYEGVLTYYTAAYQLMLTGFGTALRNEVFNTSSFLYTLEGDTITLRDDYGQVKDVVRIIEINGQKAYMSYTEALDQTFTTVNGGELTLDGLCNASYTVNGATVKGYYTVATSVFGGVIVSFQANDQTYKFLITVTTEDRPVEGGAEGETEKVDVYTVSEKLPTYAEYYYFSEGQPDFAPMLVIDDPKVGEAIVYGYTNARTYVEVSRGTYKYDESTKLYVYTAKTFANAEDLTDIQKPDWDLSAVKSFVFALDSSSTSYNINYWYSVERDDGAEAFDARYTGANGEKLTVVAGLGVYEAEGYILTGAITKQGMLTVIQSSNGSVYLEIDEENKTFIALDGAPYNAYLLAANGQTRKDAGISFDGKGGATYSELIKNEAGETEQVDYVGTFVQTEETTAFGAYVCVFTSNDGTKTFKYIQLTASSTSYIAPYNPEYNGEYESATGFLTLDGYGYWANYVCDGNIYEGVYMIVSENVVCLSTQENGVFYFDLKEDRSFTVRGKEYGTYVVFNNQDSLDRFFELDGYGKLSVFIPETNEANENVSNYIDTNGTYVIDGDVVTMTYTDEENKKIVYVGEFGVYEYGSSAINAFYISRTEVTRTFVNKDDWSVMVFDDIGNAVKYSKEGVKTVGDYVMITDELLYFVTEDGSEANIYKYDLTEGTLDPIELEERGYYTKNLESLIFSEHGFAIFNGATRYYYNVVNNNATIYRQDVNNPNANKYGFVEEDFGEFSKDVVEYDDKTYYYNNDGYGLSFKREESTKDDYPVLVKEAEKEGEEDIYSPLENLSFQPTGMANFKNVTGSVTVAGKPYTCYVSRFVDEETGEVEMYVTVGNYRFDIEVSYEGFDENGNSISTYKVTRLRLMQTYESYMYMQVYYMYYMGYFSSMIPSGAFGSVSISREFHKDGTEFDGGPYFNGTFGVVSGMYDANGELISIENAEYETMEGSDIMKVEFVAKDGYTYRLYVGTQMNQAFRAYGYVIYALTRVQTFSTENGYTVEVERAITTEAQGVYKGYPLFMTIKQGEVEVPQGMMIFMDGYTYYVSRTYAENEDGSQGKIISTKYYRVEFVEDISGGILEEDSPVILPYASASIELEEAITKYSADEKSYVDMIGDEVKILSFNGTLYLAKTTTKNEDGSYTVLTTYGTSFILKVLEDGTITLEEIEEKETESTL